MSSEGGNRMRLNVINLNAAAARDSSSGHVT